MEEDDLHFLVQSVPVYSPKKILQTIRSITAKNIFSLFPEEKEILWGGGFWMKGHYANREALIPWSSAPRWLILCINIISLLVK